ncbi:MAG TPA: universal stress protein [Bryobacteraceae bacterium]|nr:universal stress protein [Bryobacteraceae bacterium]
MLLTTDGSDRAVAAIRTAARILNPEDRDIDVLSVVPPHRPPGELAGATRTKILEEARALIGPNPKAVSLLRETGSPAVVIANKTGDYDLTVVGSRGAGFRDEAGLGPVASRVVEHAARPVLVGRALRSEDGFRALVAVDGSSASLHAVETLSNLFDLTSAEVSLMYVAETPWLNVEGDLASASEEEIETSEAAVLEKQFIREGQELIEDARKLLRRYRPLVNSRIEEGNPADAILAEAERGQYDLVVLGATGNRDVRYRMLGSVSFRIAWDAPCSVLIVREPGETG